MKFNTLFSKANETVNYMGGKAYILTPALELYTTVVSTMLDNSYYEKADDRLVRIKNLVPLVDPVFVAKLAIYTREEMYLRTVPLVLVTELAKVHKGDNLVSRTVERIVQRADEITELLAYYELSNERKGVKKLNKLSKQIQKGLAGSFNKFDAYQLAKYNRDAHVKLKDALFLIHPKAKSETQQEIFNQLVADTLPVPYTWETELSKLGQMPFGSEKEKQEKKAAKWEELVLSGKIGYMALLRNLRNITTQGTDLAVQAALQVITDRSRVKTSKQLPFRYLSAYAELETELKSQVHAEKEKNRIQAALQALEKAVIMASDNIPVADGITLILSDNSGSMYGDAGGKSVVSAMSKRTTADIANLFAVLYWMRAQNTIVGLFGDRLITPELQRNKNVFENFAIVNTAAKKCGASTEQGIFDMMEQLIDTKKMVDRIVIFSDCQVGSKCNWYDHKRRVGNDFNKLFQHYRKMNPHVVTYSVDLKGYGNTLFDKGVMTIGGWSEKLFDMMVALEEGESVVSSIESIHL
ncbi:TROVE domain-containing protein [Rhodocytophaga rosea]|uniref:TROVE domain-containing protein n=1 Tax=Rhodocytophaga rosea TaxID=2704465 RepID=A0A6C0GNA1_9BACT|nr:TROVE domain-containing protein [Rhodocytophaga rosea]QHT69505.1 TROVE domain-containing protein [Rhodocytophaga rosea]